MGFFNDKQVEAFETDRYICSECGAVMKFEDKWEDVLICPECGHSIDSDRYGCESDGKDFFIGDIVQITNEYGMESRARISEIVTAIDTQGTVTYPTLSTVP